jgi:hypothetical protein
LTRRVVSTCSSSMGSGRGSRRCCTTRGIWRWPRGIQDAPESCLRTACGSFASWASPGAWPTA